jgi:hypothetical protein
VTSKAITLLIKQDQDPKHIKNHMMTQNLKDFSHSRVELIKKKKKTLPSCLDHMFDTIYSKEKFHSLLFLTSNIQTCSIQKRYKQRYLSQIGCELIPG